MNNDSGIRICFINCGHEIVSYSLRLFLIFSCFFLSSIFYKESNNILIYFMSGKIYSSLQDINWSDSVSYLREVSNISVEMYKGNPVFPHQYTSEIDILMQNQKSLISQLMIEITMKIHWVAEM